MQMTSILILITQLIGLCCIATACALQEKGDTNMIMNRTSFKKGRLMARLENTLTKDDEVTFGVQSLHLDRTRDGFIYVPKGYDKKNPAALAVMLHGAGGDAEHGLSLLKKYADDNNIILLAPASRLQTWDIIVNDSFGPDVIFIDQALSLVFDKFAINPLRIAIGGFSDGASYALCIGLTNGDLFTHIIAFSPGFSFTMERKGKPSTFISHGTNDNVLPIDPCSRRIVPRLRKDGLTVTYQEFAGEHEIPSNISHHAVEWFTENNEQ
jgi:predicted esterase